MVMFYNNCSKPAVTSFSQCQGRQAHLGLWTNLYCRVPCQLDLAGGMKVAAVATATASSLVRGTEFRGRSSKLVADGHAQAKEPQVLQQAMSPQLLVSHW